MRSCPAALLLILVTAWAAAATEVPLRAQGNVLVVQATLNGKVAGPFLLDTGATYCVVTEAVAREAKLRRRNSGERIRLVTANGPIEAVLAEARRVEVGDESQRDVAVAVVEDDPVPGLKGILGLSFLSRFRYTVDLQAGLLRLEE